MHLLKSALAPENAGDVQFQPHTPVVSVSDGETSGNVEVQTTRGTIRAKSVVHTTNAYLAYLLPQYEKSIIPCRGFCSHISVSSSQPAPTNITQSYIIRSAQSGSVEYLISRPDGSVVLGGAGVTYRADREKWFANTRDDEIVPALHDYFADYMQRTFAGWEQSDAEVKKIWSGSMCEFVPASSAIDPFCSTTPSPTLSIVADLCFSWQ